MGEERWIYVACDCFKLGRTSLPPTALHELTLDHVGDVVPIGGDRSRSIAGSLREWVADRACPHRGMREFETLLDVDWEYQHPLLAHYADEFKQGEYPVLKSILGGPHERQILILPGGATEVIEELDWLWSHPLSGQTTVLVDEVGVRVWPFLEPDGLDAGRGFTPIYCRSDLGEGPADILQVGVEGPELVVRSASTHEELLRSPTIGQELGTGSIEVDDYTMRDVTYSNPATGATVQGYAEPIYHPREGTQRVLYLGPRYPRVARVQQVPLTVVPSEVVNAG